MKKCTPTLCSLHNLFEYIETILFSVTFEQERKAFIDKMTNYKKSMVPNGRRNAENLIVKYIT